jgi:nitroreductase
MGILELIKKRRSIRKFQKKEISKEIINKLGEALIWAPSAGNLQSRKFYFVLNQKIKEELAKAALSQDFITQAFLVVVGCADLNIKDRYGRRGKELYSICDVSASIENLLLTVQAEGLGACWVGAFDEKKVSEILRLSQNLKPIALVPIGWPAESPAAPPRASKEEAIKIIE